MVKDLSYLVITIELGVHDLMDKTQRHWKTLKNVHGSNSKTYTVFCGRFKHGLYNVAIKHFQRLKTKLLDIPLT